MRLIKLMTTGIIGGVTLTFVMYFINIATGNKAYILLYNVDYIPILRQFQDSTIVGFVFHFVFCMISVIVLFYLLKYFHIENYFLPYLFTYSIGSAILYFLSFLTNKPPLSSDEVSWLYWTMSHILFGIVVGLLIKYWVNDQSDKSSSKTRDFIT